MTIQKLLAGAAVIGLAMPAAAVTIDFEAAPNGSLTDFYAADGVHFSNATVISLGAGYDAGGGTHQVNATVGGYASSPSNPIIASFDFAVTNVSLTGIDIGQAGFELSSYDIDGSLLSTQQFFGPGVGVGTFQTLTLTDSGIRSIHFSQANPCCGDGALFDKLVFEADDVPEPAMLGLFGMGAIGLGLSRRRRA